jgi:hypothetical protein
MMEVDFLVHAFPLLLSEALICWELGTTPQNSDRKDW